MNIFIEQILNGKINTKQQLKKAFWMLAKKIHPDIQNAENSDQLFIELKNYYDEALLLLPKIEEQRKEKQYTILEFQNTFEELIAIGFPVERKIREKSKVYIDRINECSEIVKYIGISGVVSFYEVERELYEIRGDNIVQNHLFGMIKMIFYNLISYYYEPRKFIKNALDKWFLEIDNELVRRKYSNTYWFIKWQIDNLKKS